MYAHQVLEYLKQIDLENPSMGVMHLDDHRTIKLPPLPGFKELVRLSISQIVHAHKFHIEDAKGVWDGLKTFNRAGEKLFLEKKYYHKMPYKIIWLDYVDNVSTAATMPTTRAVLAVGFDDPDDFLWLMFFQRIKGTAWTMLPFFNVVSIGKLFCDRPDLIQHPVHGKLIEKHIVAAGQADAGNIATGFTYGGINKNNIIVARFDYTATYGVAMLDVFLKWLHCKNIISVKVPTPDRLNKKRRKNNRQELFSYHVLRIKPTKAEKANGKPYQGGLNRIHFCRGHFKEYTEDNPLFGKYTGLYWWQAHVRGRNKKGIVMKDYRC